MLATLAQLFQHDQTLQILVMLVPLAIFLDVVLGSVNAVKAHSFSFRLLADFARHDLHAFVVIILAALGSIASGINITATIAGEKTAIVVLLVSILTSVGVHLQDLTGVPVAFWETLLNQWFAKLDQAPEVPNVPAVTPVTTLLF